MAESAPAPAPSPNTHTPRRYTVPTMMYLTPAERLELEKRAQDEMRSISATARMVYLRGSAQPAADPN